VLSIDSEVYNIKCSPVQVNGAPITGCKCNALNKNPDVAAAEAGSWTVSGCTSVGANIIGYEWSGATPDATGMNASYAFTKKNQALAPIVKVSNDDNTIVSVPCDTVIAVDGNDPDYILTKSDTKIALPAGESTLVLDLPPTWHNTTEGTCTLRCDGANQPITITVGAESSMPDYSATLMIPISKTIGKTPLVIGLDVAANCQVAY